MIGRIVMLTIIAGLALSASAPPVAAELKPHTLAAFDRYVALTEARLAGEARDEAPFLWMDRQPPAERAAILARLKAGAVEVAKLETRDGRAKIDVRDGLIHHWIGSVFLPGVTIERAVGFIQDYERYPDYFGPTIVRARVVSRAGPRFEVSMRTVTRKVITVVIDADYVIDYEIEPSRVRTKNIATRLFEVHDAGKTSESGTPVEQGGGYLWRLNNYCSLEAIEGGTIEQCESVSLSRDIPFGLGWIVGPFVRGLPRETLEFTLGRVRSRLAGPTLF